MPHPRDWLIPRPEGLYCVPADAWIDPIRPVPRAIVTHGHSDHARPGLDACIATPETLAIMAARLGPGAPIAPQPLRYGEALTVGDARLRLVPAGHVLGSAQVVIEHAGSRAVISGDYKREADPTCAPFEPVICDLFVTEATFALPVFRHPSAHLEVARLLKSLELFPERTHVVGAYALGKCQRVIALLRRAGYRERIWLHGAMRSVCALYQEFGVDLGELAWATAADRAQLRGAVVLAPPSAISDTWARRLNDPVTCMASGWMRVRQRARARGVELPMVISDHADWDALLATCLETQASEIWVTHGREEALIRALALEGVEGRALRLLGYGDEGEEDATDASARETAA